MVEGLRTSPLVALLAVHSPRDLRDAGKAVAGDRLPDCPYEIVSRMDGEDDTLGREANQATIRSAWYAKVGIVLTVAALLWTIFSDVVLSDEDSAVPTPQQTSTVTADVETATADANTSAPESEADASSASAADAFVGYFRQAASDTGQWRSHQAFWQLAVWWIVLAGLYLWFVNGRLLLPTFRTGVVMLAAYLWIFWPSLSGFGAGLAFGVTLLLILGLVVSEGL